MKKWKASMQEKFEDLPHNVKTWREALRRASQRLDDAWQTAAAEHEFLRGNPDPGHGFHAQKG